MNKEVDEKRCYLCGIPLGESSNVLYVEGQWVHYQCAFRQSVEKVNGKEKSSA